MSICRRLTACLLGLLLLHAVFAVSWAQDPLDEPDPELQSLETKVRTFLKGISSGQSQTAYSELLGTELKRQKVALQDLIEKTDKIEEQYGTYRAFEQIAAKRVGKDLILMKYLYKCDDYPVVWYFTFYRTPSDPTGESGPWRVVTVRFDTELELLAF